MDDVYELLYKHQSSIVCLQETHLNPKQSNFLKQYTVFRKDRDAFAHSSGGVAIVTRKSIPSQSIRLLTSLEAVAVRVIIFGRLITICSLYIPPDHQLSTSEFESLVNELPEPFILVGDLNAHNKLWGSGRTDARGRLIEHFLVSSGACLFNKKQPTYYNITHNTYSHIDLAIGSAVLFPLVEWQVEKNPLGSDHFPVP